MAVVTGANKGIGFESARLLGKEGLKVVITSRNITQGQAASAKLQSLEPSGSFTTCQLDITDAASVAACAEFLRTSFKKVDILINNAAVALEFQGIQLNADAAQQTMDCNVTVSYTHLTLPTKA